MGKVDLTSHHPSDIKSLSSGWCCLSRPGLSVSDRQWFHPACTGSHLGLGASTVAGTTRWGSEKRFFLALGWWIGSQNMSFSELAFLLANLQGGLDVVSYFSRNILYC